MTCVIKINTYLVKSEACYTADMSKSPAETANDEDLMLRYATQGDCAAFELLVARHASGLKKYLFFMCYDDAIAEDLVQEAWVKLIRARECYKPSAKFKTYLYTIGHHCFIDGLRKIKARPITVSSQSEEGVEQISQVQSRDQPLDQQYQNQASRKQLFNAIKKLPEAQRAALLLYGEGYSINEISEITKCHYEKVKSQLRYAKDKIKSIKIEFMGKD